MSTPTRSVADQENSLAVTAHESIRAINHLTIATRPIPAPEIYGVLGHLTPLGYGLDQALRQLARALVASVDAYALYEDDGGDPEQSIAYAIEAMHAAADHATQLGQLLQAAQDDLSRQGYYTPQEGR
jgi:hypothetical protein